MEPYIGIKSESIETVAEMLTGILADEFVLYVQTLNAHWNVESPFFFSLHELFEKQNDIIVEVIDDLPERIRALGVYAPATLHEYLQLTHLTERSEKTNNAKTFLKDLLTSHENIILKLRMSIDSHDHKTPDAGTSDFITNL